MRVRRGWLLVLPLVLAGCGRSAAPGSGTGPAGAPSSVVRATSAAPAPLADCGPAPVSDGTSRDLIGASVTGPATATSGTVLHLAVSLHSLDGATHVFESGASELVIVLHGRVVGDYEGAEAGYGVQATVTPSGVAAWQVSGLLAGCPPQPVDPGAPDLARKALPPGAYDVVAVLPDVAGHPSGHLVTPPVRVQVTADPAALPTCGDVPVSSEPPQSRVAAQLTGPAEARAGSTIEVQVLLRSNRGRPEHLVTAVPPDFLLVKAGSVVGRTDTSAGAGRDLLVPAASTIPLTGSDDPASFGQVTLAGCPRPTGQDSGVASASPRAPLPPGDYQLVGVLEDDVAGRHGVLLTQPLTVHVS